MSHYVCSGDCRGVSEIPGVCQSADCLRHGQSLEECSCADSKHGWESEEDEQSFEGQLER